MRHIVQFANGFLNQIDQNFRTPLDELFKVQIVIVIES